MDSGCQGLGCVIVFHTVQTLLGNVQRCHAIPFSQGGTDLRKCTLAGEGQRRDALVRTMRTGNQQAIFTLTRMAKG